MLHIKLLNIQILNTKLNHRSLLDWPILQEKNILYKSFYQKNPKTEEYYEKQFKLCRNNISSLLRVTKDSYYKQYFKDSKKILG